MDESYVRRAVFRAARLAGLWPITQTDASRCSHCGHLVRPPPGRPDILGMNPVGRSIVIEVKTVRPKETAFAFADIDDRQRKWLNRWHEDGGQGYIGLGIIRQHGQMHGLDHLYLIPWGRWLAAEEIVSSIQESIPVQAAKGTRRELQDGKLDIVTVFADLELERTDGVYQWPEQS